MARLQPGAEVVHRLDAGRTAFVYLVDGAASFDREDVSTGDTAVVSGRPGVVIRAWQTSELVLLDVATVPPAASPPPNGQAPAGRY